MITTQELKGKISALKNYKPYLDAAIGDEQEAQRGYDTLIAQSRNARTTDSSEIQGIKDQERTHADKLKNMLKSTERNIKEYERQLEDEQRKLADEKRKKDETERRKRDEAQRKAKKR